MRKHRRAVRGEVRAVADALRRHWDPIGQGVIAELPGDEYDGYAPRVLALLQMGVTDRTLAAHLAALEAGPLGLTPRPEAELVAIAGAIRQAAASARAG